MQDEGEALVRGKREEGWGGESRHSPVCAWRLARPEHHVGAWPRALKLKLTHRRNDFYQTGTSVIASLYLKKIDKDSAKVTFHADHVDLDLRTSDSKRYATEFPLYGPVKPEDCKYRILGTKLELTLVKADSTAWPVLRSDDKLTGEMIQVGRAGRV